MSAAIRVAFFIDDLGIGGTQTWLTLLVPALVKRGFDCRVYCMRAIAHPANLERLRACAQVEVIGEARLRAGPGLLHLYRALRTWPADVVQTALPTSDMIGRTLGRLAGVPAIFSSVRGRGWEKPAWQCWLDRRTARWARAIVFNNMAGVPTAVQREGVRPEQVVYIRNGVDISVARRRAHEIRREFDTAPDAPVVGSVARLHHSKGQDDLFRAFALLRQQSPSAVLWLVGEGDRRNALERTAQQLGIAAHVRMPGTRTDVRDLLEAMDVFALPSHWEGMPNALLEAMAAGRPAVASDVDGARDLIRHGETGWQVAPGDVGLLARTLFEVLANRQHAASVGKAAQAWVQEHYSVDRMADAFANLYSSGLAT